MSHKQSIGNMKGRDTTNFRLDEYEQSTEEFEKYVQAINSQPLPVRKGTAQPDLKSAVLDYVSRYKTAESSDLHQLYSILKAVKDWGADAKQKAVNAQVYQLQCKLALLAAKHKDFKRQLQRLDSQLQSLRANQPQFLDAAGGFESQDALDDALNQMTMAVTRNIQQGTTGENEQLGREMERLKGLRSRVKEYERYAVDLQTVALERSTVEKFLKDTAEDFKALKVREGYLSKAT